MSKHALPEDCPLSQDTLELWDKRQSLAARREALGEERSAVIVQLAAAQTKYDEFLQAATLSGTISKELLKRARLETGLQEVQDHLDALDTLLANIPSVEASLLQKFKTAQRKESRDTLDQLHKEFTQIIRAEVLPALRPVGRVVDRLEAIRLKAHRWELERRSAEKYEAEYAGHPFPRAPITCATDVIVWATRMFMYQINGRG